MKTIKMVNNNSSTQASELIDEISHMIGDRYTKVEIDRYEDCVEGTKGLITVSAIISIAEGVIAAAIFEIVKESIKKIFTRKETNNISIHQDKDKMILEMTATKDVYLIITFEEDEKGN